MRVLIRTHLLAILSTLTIGLQPASAGEVYQRPPKAVLDVLDAPATPSAMPSPDGKHPVLAQPLVYPPISDLAEPMLRLAGVRINPRLNAPHGARYFVALTLKAVIAQVLLPRADGHGRVAAREVVFVNPAVANLIREDKIHQVPNAIATGGREDMISLDDALADLVERGAITFETAYPFFEDTEKRGVLQKRHYRPAAIPETGARRA